MAFWYAMAFSLAILLGFVLNHSASIQYLPSFTLTNNLVCQHIRAICYLKSEGGTSVSSSSVISNDGFESISLACYAAVFSVTTCRRADPQHAMSVDDTNGDEQPTRLVTGINTIGD